MPKRKYTDENTEFPLVYKQKNFLRDPTTLHVMKEMDVVNPRNSSHYFEEHFSSKDNFCPTTPLQVINGTKRRTVVIPETDQSFKTFRHDFVLFQKSPLNCSPGEDHFSRLSDEIILQIFEWLPKSTLVKCAQVCKRWKTLSYDESLWPKFDFGKKYVESGVLDIILQRGVSALRLAMANIKSPVFVEPEFASKQRFCKLRYLDLSMATVSPETLADILAVCSKLKKLSLEACKVNEECCKFIARNTTLEILNMSMCSGLTPMGLRAIAFSCVNLKEWNLAWTLLDQGCLKTFLPLLTNSLKKLNISGHRETLEDIDLLTIAHRCPNLVELDISDCHLLTEASFMPLIKTCCKLEHLHTSRAYKIPTHCYRYLKHLKKFTHLEIFRTLTDDALASLREFMPEIKINTKLFSTIARPTTGIKRTSIWGMRVRD